MKRILAAIILICACIVLGAGNVDAKHNKPPKHATPTLIAPTATPSRLPNYPTPTWTPMP